MNDEAAVDGGYGASDAPFEWLTSFEAYQHFVLPSTVLGPSALVEEGCTGIQLNALHVGCGTSTAGESLFCLRERLPNAGGILRYGCVVNVDKDIKALGSLERRWKGRTVIDDESSGGGGGGGKMVWKQLDFSSRASCRASLDDVYRNLARSSPSDQSPLPNRPPGSCFDLIFDKSTLDCLLCAEPDAVTGLLCEVYRGLRAPKRDAIRGGVYVVISFHPYDFVRRLLDLPGAEWTVDYRVVKRQVEDISDEEVGISKEVPYTGGSGSVGSEDSPSSSAWSESGVFQPDENYRKTVGVFTCRRRRLSNSDGHDADHRPNYILNWDAVREHVISTCDHEYRATSPLVTIAREEQIRDAFTMELRRQRGVLWDGKNPTLSLKDGYEVIFTPDEKTHYEFDCFLDDWKSYCDSKRLNKDTNSFSVVTALDFLHEMQ